MCVCVCGGGGGCMCVCGVVCVGVCRRVYVSSSRRKRLQNS